MLSLRAFYLSGLFLIVMSAAHSAQIPINLTSLEWPPYTGKDLPEQGYTTALIRAAFAQQGYALQVDFYPWSRAVLLAKQPDGEYAGYFPEYFAHSVATQFIFSDAIGESPLGLAYYDGQAFDWQTYDDLKHYTIGVVQDYVNTDVFDRNVADSTQRVEVVSTDWQNLKKLSALHLRAAIIDAHVLRFLLHNKAPIYQAIRLHPRLLETKNIYVCFGKGVRGLRLIEVLHDGLQQVDRAALMKSFPYFNHNAPAPNTSPTR